MKLEYSRVNANLRAREFSIFHTLGFLGALRPLYDAPNIRPHAQFLFTSATSVNLLLLFELFSNRHKCARAQINDVVTWVRKPRV